MINADKNISQKTLITIILMGIVGVIALFLIIKPFKFFQKGAKMPFTRTRPNFQVPTENVRKVILDNGMTVLVYPNHDIPKVLVQIAYSVGSYVEQGGERGLAHLIEHMIFKGTQKLSESDIDGISRKFGATFNAFTSKDVTSYYFEVNKNNWKPFLGILADCMQNARFEEQHLASELKTVIQELKMYQDDYWNMMFEKINALIYPANHPYHYPIIGYKEDLMNLSAENLKLFYKKYYDPSRATLFIVGDVDVDTAIEYAHKNFDSIKANAPAPITDFPQKQQTFVSQHTRFYEDVQTEELGFYWQIPGLKDETETIATAAAYLLGAGEGSRLYRTLVDEKKIATSVGVYDQKNFESGVFLVLVEPLAGKSDECEKVIKEEILKAIENGFDDKELEHMTKMQGKRFFQKLQSNTSFVYEWLNLYFATKNELSVFERANKFVEINSDDVQKFLEKHIDPFLVNRIEVLPLPENKHEAHEQAKHDADEFDKKILSKYNRTTPVEEPKEALTIGEPKPLDFTFPKPEKEIELDNGLTVLLRTKKTLPLISLNLTFKDSFYFSNAQEGIILDLMMGMLMEASDGFTKDENVDFFEFNGVDYSFNARGGKLSLLSSEYQTIFERFFHVLTKPKFQNNALEKIKDITIDSFKRDNDNPVNIAIRQLKTLIYKNHPFAWTYEDAIKTTEEITLENLKQLHKDYVSPEKMILSLVGDFDLEQMEKAVRSIFTAWEKGPLKTIAYPRVTFTPGATFDKSMVRDQVALLMGQPSTVDIHNPDLIPLKLLNYICFYSLGSRIYQVREQTGIFYEAFGAWAANAGTETGFDFVGAILSPEKLEFAETEMRNLIDKMAKDGITQEELNSAQQLYLKTLIDAVSSNASVADVFGTLKSFDLGFGYYDNVLKRVQAIGIPELNTISAKYFTTDKLARVRVGRI